MNCATPSPDNSSYTKLSFDLTGARPIPAPASSLLCWQGNLIHWGSSCAPRAAEAPRQSLACTFRRNDSQVDTETHLTKHQNNPPLALAELSQLSPMRRLKLITSSLFLYEYWYSLDESPLPSVFTELLV